MHLKLRGMHMEFKQLTGNVCCCAALTLPWRCAGGWKYRHASLWHRPFMKSIQTVIIPSEPSTATCPEGCANLHSSLAHKPLWNSRQTCMRTQKLISSFMITPIPSRIHLKFQAPYKESSQVCVTLESSRQP